MIVLLLLKFCLGSQTTLDKIFQIPFLFPWGLPFCVLPEHCLSCLGSTFFSNSIAAGAFSELNTQCVSSEIII